MGMSDINRINRQQQRMTELDKARLEYEVLEYNLTHNPENYRDELELAKARYAELKAYFEDEESEAEETLAKMGGK